MDYKEINKVLSNLDKYAQGNGAIETTVINGLDYDSSNEGEEGETHYIFNFNKEENIFLKAIVKTDSYGDNERLASLQFVQPVEVKVQNYTEIN